MRPLVAALPDDTRVVRHVPQCIPPAGAADARSRGRQVERRGFLSKSGSSTNSAAISSCAIHTPRTGANSPRMRPSSVAGRAFCMRRRLTYERLEMDHDIAGVEVLEDVVPSVTRIARAQRVVDRLQPPGLLATAQVGPQAEPEQRRCDDDHNEAVGSDRGDMALPLMRSVEVVVDRERPAGRGNDEMQQRANTQRAQNQLQVGPAAAARTSRRSQLRHDEARQHEHQQGENGDERRRHVARRSRRTSLLYSSDVVPAGA